MSSSNSTHGRCARCGDTNPYTGVLCSGCNSRLPWASVSLPRNSPPSITLPAKPTQIQAVKPITISIVSGQMDVHRCDYLPTPDRIKIMLAVSGSVSVLLLLADIVQQQTLSFASGIAVTLGIVTLIAFAVWQRNAKRRQIEASIRGAAGFTASDLFIDHNMRGLAADRNCHNLCLILRRKSGFTLRFLRADMITAVNISEDFGTMTTSGAGMSSAGCLAGGCLLGIPGALLGGMALGDKKTEQKVSGVELQIQIRDVDYPLHRVSFLSSTSQAERGGSTHRSSREDAERWQALINAIKSHS